LFVSGFLVGLAETICKLLFNKMDRSRKHFTENASVFEKV
jgi:hypothetical protein